MSEPTRRTVLRAAGVAGLAALAGCTGAASTDEPTETGHDHGEHSHEETDTATPTHHDHEGHTHGEVEGPKPSAEVRMMTTEAGHHFDPHVVWVEEGGTVTWVNESGAHTTTAYAPANDRPRRIPEGAEAWGSGLFTESGATFEHTFEVEGVYDYYCVPHEGLGMIGTVVVGEPDPHDQPGLAEPREALPEAAREKIERLNERVNEVLGHAHHEGTATEEGHHEEGGHHGETATEDGHHDDH